MALSATLSLDGTALAGSKGGIKEQEKSAQAACLLGDYQTGTKILVDLYIQTRKPVYLFNQGRCYEQNSRWGEALDRFREFLRKSPGVEESVRRDVEKHMAECEFHLAKEASVPPLTAPPGATPVAETPSPALAPAADPAPAAAVAPVTDDSGSRWRIAGIVTAAVGVVALGYGTYEYIRHESLIDDMKKKSDQLSDKQFSDKRSQINGCRTRSWVGFGVGAAALAAGATMYFVGWMSASSDTNRATLSLAPSIGPGQTSLLLSGGF